MFNLSEKTALVTGATGGIGKSIAKTLHASGAKLCITGRNEAKLQDLANELKDNVIVLPADLSNLETIDETAAKAEELTGGIDILINNAGVTRDNLSMRMKDEEWNEVININLSAPFMLAKALQRPMMKRKWGRIVNIASIVGVTGNPGQCNYVASKAGMIGWSKSMAIELASRNITVNCIAPGFIETAMTGALNDAQKDAILAKIPQNKMGTPDDIASAALFLASIEAGYVTGQTIHVNGGMAMI